MNQPTTNNQALQTTTMQQHAKAHEVFNIPELLEAILLQSSPHSMARWQLVNRQWRNTLQQSPTVQRRLHLRASSTAKEWLMIDENNSTIVTTHAAGQNLAPGVRTPWHFVPNEFLVREIDSEDIFAPMTRRAQRCKVAQPAYMTEWAQVEPKIESHSLRNLPPTSSLRHMTFGTPTPMDVTLVYTRFLDSARLAIRFNEADRAGRAIPMTLDRIERRMAQQCPSGFKIDRILIAGAVIVPEAAMEQIRDKGFLRPSPFGKLFGGKGRIQYPRNLGSVSNDPPNKWMGETQYTECILGSPQSGISSSIYTDRTRFGIEPGIILAIISNLSPVEVVRFSQVCRRSQRFAWDMPRKTFTPGEAGQRDASFVDPLLGFWIINTRSPSNNDGIVGRIEGGAIQYDHYANIERLLNRDLGRDRRLVVRKVVALNPHIAMMAIPGQRAKAQAASDGVLIAPADGFVMSPEDSRRGMVLTVPVCSIYVPGCGQMDGVVQCSAIPDFGRTLGPRTVVHLLDAIVPTEEDFEAARRCPSISVRELRSGASDLARLAPWLANNAQEPTKSWPRRLKTKCKKLFWLIMA